MSGSKQAAQKSTFFDKPLLAPGAGNGKFALTAGNADGLLALRAGEVAMLPILDPLQEDQKFPVFLVTLVGIPGKGTEEGPEH